MKPTNIWFHFPIFLFRISLSMYNTKALITIRASAKLSAAQHEEFARLTPVYTKSANFCLEIWSAMATQYRYGFNRNAAVQVSRQFEDALVRILKIPTDDQWLANCALKDTLRQLREHNCHGKPKPEQPVHHQSLRIYRGFDVKVTKGYAILPAIGVIDIGRFPTFSGRIAATGLEVYDGEVTCVVLYEPDVKAGVKKALA